MLWVILMDKCQKYIPMILLIATILLSMIIIEGYPEKTQEPIFPSQSVTTEEKNLLVSVKDKSGIVVKIELNDYLVCVLLSEMPTSFSEEALKAQAVVARTYTLLQAKNGKKHEDCDVCMDSRCCQGYKTVEEYLKSGGNNLNKVKKAVEDTKELVLTYNDKLIDATYFSCSGGNTEDAVAVWGKDVPYLQAKESPGEEFAAHYTDQVSFSSVELGELLGISVQKSPSLWVESITYTAGGGVDEITICGKNFRGVELRNMLNLRSTAFTIAVQDDEFVFSTKGYGHRVGMSQYGAEAMAKKGVKFDEILLYYYTGVTLTEYRPED